ncbi:MAG: hypothetical protein V3W34_12385 [Phycisphaerae bacterium]
MLLAFWLMLVAGTCSRMDSDPDIWGHTLYGIRHLSLGESTPNDPFSYTAANAPWVNHEWLCELIFGLLWQKMGTAGFWAMRLMFVALSLFIVLSLTYESTRGLWAGLILLPLGCLELAQGYSFRPQLFTYMGLALVMLLACRIHQQRRWSVWWTFLVVPLLCCWVNWHGGFVVGLCFLSFLLLHQSVEHLRGNVELSRLAVTTAAILAAWLATLINPYGFGLWAWMWQALSTSRSMRITEWATAAGFERQYSLIPFYTISALTVATLILTRRKRDWFEWGIMSAMCVASWLQTRHSGLFCMAVIAYLPKYIESAFPGLARPSTFSRAFVSATCIIAALFAVGIHFTSGHRPTTILVDLKTQPYNALSFIKANKLQGNFVVMFDWAQFAIWHLHDTSRVAFDGRFRTVYPKTVEDDYFRFHLGREQWSNLLDDYDTQLVLMGAHWPALERMKQRKDWRMVYHSGKLNSPIGVDQESEEAVVFLKRGEFPQFEERLDRGQVMVPVRRTMFRFDEPLASEDS